MDLYKNKYNKYKLKYIKLKELIGGNYNILDLDKNPSEHNFTEFKRILDMKKNNWLVFYSGFNTKSEKIRFSNPNWIFYDWNVDETRIGIQGNINSYNIKLLSEKLTNCFNYICFDWDLFQLINTSDEFIEIIGHLFNLLNKNGKIFIKNINNIIQEDIEDETSLFTRVNSLGVPLGQGAGGQNIISKIFQLLFDLKNIYLLNINTNDYIFIKKLETLMFMNIDPMIIQQFYNNICYIHSIINSSKDCLPFKNNYEIIIKELKDNLEFNMQLENDFYKLLQISTDEWKMPNRLNKDVEDEKNKYIIIEKK